MLGVLILIWITGDKHGQLEPFLQNPIYKKIKKNDTLLICGDFGFLWNDSKEELRNLRWLSKRRFKVAFVEGCFDNQQILARYPLTNWNGGRARMIFENVIHLLNGEFYIIEDKKILTYGGGFDESATNANQGSKNMTVKVSFKSQIDNLIRNIKRAEKNFDLIISHEAPSSIANCLNSDEFHCNYINNILEEIRNHTNFKKWFFGKYHIDKIIPPRYYAMFNEVIKL